MVGKTQIVDRAVARGAERGQAAAALDAVLDEITTALAAGERVTLVGFGTFEAAKRNARSARNPRSGAVVVVPETTVARFRAGTSLRAAVAGRSGTKSTSVSSTTASAAVPSAVTAPATEKSVPAREVGSPPVPEPDDHKHKKSKKAASTAKQAKGQASAAQSHGRAASNVKDDGKHAKDRKHGKDDKQSKQSKHGTTSKHGKNSRKK
ncbi:HU family DNA-binding protein [Cellulomonas sp. URHB0016]